MVSKCSAHRDIAPTWRHNNRNDGLTTAGQTATCWKTTEIRLKMKQSGLKKDKEEGRTKVRKKVYREKGIQLSVVKERISKKLNNLQKLKR